MANNAKRPTIPLDMGGVLTEMAHQRPVFHSEADFQHAFAWEVHRQVPDASIRLEKPLTTIAGVAHLDVLIQREGATVAVELKYKTKKLTHQITDEAYNLRSHGAQDLGRYDFMKDIGRLEDISASFPSTVGYAVLLTNESSYWRNPLSSKTVDAAFRLHEGRVLSGEATWGAGASKGTMKSREKPIKLRGSYKLEWHDYSALQTNKDLVFRYLLVAVPSYRIKQ
jgi:hypothetical protein